MHRTFTTIIAAVAFSIASSTFVSGEEAPKLRRPADNDALARQPADHVIRYDDADQTYMDLRLPDPTQFGPGPYPVVMVIHGGCWVRPYASAYNIGALADGLRGAGYATLNLEYRTVDEAGGGWPGTFHDVAAAFDRIPLLAQDHPLDPGKVAAIGHSAGGHLAQWALARPAISKNSPLYREAPLALKGAIALGGPADLLAAREDWIKGCGVDSVTVLLGGAELRTLNAQAGSPAELLPYAGQQIFITGEHDRIVPQRIGDAYVNRAIEAGANAVHHKIDGIGHHDPLDPAETRSWGVILESLSAIFSDG